MQTGGGETVGTSVAILSAMITPTILIPAASSLVGATTTRLERLMGAMHELSESFDRHLEHQPDRQMLNMEQMSLMLQIERTTRRVRLLQYTVALFHVSITMFVLTQIALGLDAASPLRLGLTPVAMGLLGALLLLASIVVLVRDAVIAVAATKEEADFTLRMTELHAAHQRQASRTRSPVSWS